MAGVAPAAHHLDRGMPTSVPMLLPTALVTYGGRPRVSSILTRAWTGLAVPVSI